MVRGYCRHSLAPRDLGGPVRLMFDVYAMWVPLVLSLACIGAGAMLGWMARGARK